MNVSMIDSKWILESIEWTAMYGERSRAAGKNARLGNHGKQVHFHAVRIRIAGQDGYGCSSITREKADELIGMSIRDFFTVNGIIKQAYRCIEFPLLDWLGKVCNQPVYALVGAATPTSKRASLSVPCYDTSLYFDDLHLSNDDEAVSFMQEEVQQGMELGHVHFKIKVGRGARHMDMEQGTSRDIAIIRGIREAVGVDGQMMIDANNGYNLNMTKKVLAETADANLYWLEEAFHEDDVLYNDLKDWLYINNLDVLIADGEGLASPLLVDWAKQGKIDVIQYDIISPGFSYWLELGPVLDQHGLKSAPHCYGVPFGSFALAHLSTAIDGFQFVEWDEAHVPGMDASAYRISGGVVHVPDLPGFGLDWDAPFFTQKVNEDGWSVSV